MKNSGRIEELVSELISLVDQKEGEDWYLETKRGPHGETILRGNKEGLLILMRDLGRIFESASDGSHYHYDSATTLDECEVELVIGRTVAPWDD